MLSDPLPLPTATRCRRGAAIIDDDDDGDDVEAGAPRAVAGTSRAQKLQAAAKKGAASVGSAAVAASLSKKGALAIVGSQSSCNLVVLHMCACSAGWPLASTAKVRVHAVVEAQAHTASMTKMTRPLALVACMSAGTPPPGANADAMEVQEEVNSPGPGGVRARRVAAEAAIAAIAGVCASPTAPPWGGLGRSGVSEARSHHQSSMPACMRARRLPQLLRSAGGVPRGACVLACQVCLHAHLPSNCGGCGRAPRRSHTVCAPCAQHIV